MCLEKPIFWVLELWHWFEGSKSTPSFRCRELRSVVYSEYWAPLYTEPKADSLHPHSCMCSCDCVCVCVYGAHGLKAIKLLIGPPNALRQIIQCTAGWTDRALGSSHEDSRSVWQYINLRWLASWRMCQYLERESCYTIINERLGECISPEHRISEWQVQVDHIRPLNQQTGKEFRKMKTSFSKEVNYFQLTLLNALLDAFIPSNNVGLGFAALGFALLFSYKLRIAM